MASVMAEANAHELGRDYLQPERVQERLRRQRGGLQEFLDTVGLNRVPVYIGVAHN
jgi:hypothetical protein